MALRPPPLSLRRRALTGAARASVIPPRKVRSSTSSFPLLPATAAALILLGGAQLAFWWWEAQLPEIPATTLATDGTSRANPFVALRDSAPAAKPVVVGGRLREAQRVPVTVLPQNIQFGDAMAKVTVTIFTDPACGACRARVHALTAGLPIQGVRQVYKFLPMNSETSTGGMLLELARRQGVVMPFWRMLQGAGDADLDDAALLTMLERAGVPLDIQRAAMRDDTTALMTPLEPDMKVAKDNNLGPTPVFMVDDFVLDGVVLKPEMLQAYVKKRLEGRQLFEKDDLWLMRK